MNRTQWSVGALLAVVLAIALGLGAIVSRSVWVESVAVTLQLVLLGLAITGAITAQRTARTFCVGFFIFGGGYLLASIYARQALITEWALQQVAMFQRPSKGDQVMAQWTSGSYYAATIGDIQDGQYLAVWHDGDRPLWVRPDQIRLMDGGRVTWTGHSAFGILLACVGGWVAVLLFAPREENDLTAKGVRPSAARASGTWEAARAEGSSPPPPPAAGSSHE